VPDSSFECYCCSLEGIESTSAHFRGLYLPTSDAHIALVESILDINASRFAKVRLDLAVVNTMV